MVKKLIYFYLGLFFLVLGFIGVLLPVVPTTPFILLAAFCFSKGSEKFHNWLLKNRIFGKMIQEWEEHKVISLAGKRAATLGIITLGTTTLIIAPVGIAIKSIVVVILVMVLIFIWTRPSTTIEAVERKSRRAGSPPA